MNYRIEVPHIEDLGELDVQIERSDQPGVVSVTSWADNGSSVTLTWDEIAGSASIRWLDGDEEVLTLEREIVSKVSVRDEYGGIQLRSWSTSEDLRGELIIRVGRHVSVRDALLRV